MKCIKKYNQGGKQVPAEKPNKKKPVAPLMTVRTTGYDTQYVTKNSIGTPRRVETTKELLGELGRRSYKVQHQRAREEQRRKVEEYNRNNDNSRSVSNFRVHGTESAADKAALQAREKAAEAKRAADSYHQKRPNRAYYKGKNKLRVEGL